VKFKNLTLKGRTALHLKLVVKKQHEILNQRSRKPPDSRFKAEIMNFINSTLEGQAALHPKVVAENQWKTLNQQPRKPPETRFEAENVKIEYLTLKV